MTTAELHTLTGAYALDALEEEERFAFERHLAGCESCGQEVRELTATAARLGLAASLPAPPGLKVQVMGRVAEVRQQPPDSPDSASASHRRGRVMRWALAACLAGVAALGGTTLWQYQRADEAGHEAREARAEADRVARVLSAPDARMASTDVDGAGRGSVVVSRGQDEAVFITSGMAEPPEGKVYQLWFADGDRMRPAGLMNPSRTDQSVPMTGSVGAASAVGVTLEPAGGSEQPTTSPLALLQLPA
ncbi:anti-sigma factor domain-containing protein [Streptomyces sp. NPDC057074]|uniref:anti-sigma factor n=1 Tax=Streptomyces sp. NPDC057074 TaxID=3346015 RepID=UPI003628A3BE